MPFKQNKYPAILFLTFLMALFSCRKSDERYEGAYVGFETFAILDSGETTFMLDTTYVQEIEISYTKKFRGSRNYYTFVKSFNSSGELFTIAKNSIVDHEHIPFSEIYNDQEGNTLVNSGYLKFSGDSIFLTSESYWNGDTEVFTFHGKRD